MLTEISVKNYAVIAESTLELQPGMTVLTGSTGAGKSIIVGALGLVLGQRADPTIVRDGAERAEITAHFEPNKTVLAWLIEHELDADDECLVRRVVSREGRSRAWINGHAVTLLDLRALGAQLVDIHGQHANQTLPDRANQRAILDSFANNKKQRVAVAESYAKWQAAVADLEALRAAQAERSSRLDLLRFQVQELEKLAPVADEVDALEAEQKRLSHAGRLADDSATALELLEGEERTSAQSALARSARIISALAEIDPQLKNVATLLSDADIQVSEALAELQDYATSVEVDPNRRDVVEQRLQAMQTLARKHMVDRDELPARLDALRDEFERLDNADAHLESLAEQVRIENQTYQAAAKKLHDTRVRAARKFDKAISAEIDSLGMSGGKFATAIVSRKDRPARHGTDDIEFLVSANVGQKPRPLAKVASGGELSRIGLAIEVLAAAHQPVTTMVFDEVDAGVGGGIAEIIGQKLRVLGESLQVLCVTHLPQVASQAHQHVLVNKLTDGNATVTQLVPLSTERRIDEIARMLGGLDITDATRRHAEEMLAPLLSAVGANAVDV